MVTSTAQAFSERGYDDGLEHNHHWARQPRNGDQSSAFDQGPTVSNAALLRTPSCAIHDDIHYAS